MWRIITLLRISIVLFVWIVSGWQSLAAQQSLQGGSANGSIVYAQNCIKCHGPSGQGVHAVISMAGPPLQAEHDWQTVVYMVRQGKGVMPSFAPLLSNQQIEAVADYVTQQIATIQLAPGNLGEGGKIYRVYCAPCHGTAARGGAIAFAGVNAPSLEDKTPATIAGTIRAGLGPMPAFPSSALSEKDLDAVVTYVQFLQHPPHPGGTPMNYYGSVAEGFMAWLAIILLVVATGWIEKRGRG